MQRRGFLKGAIFCSAAAIWREGCFAEDAGWHFPIVDAHIHLFDPRRPGGIPWPEPTDKVLYRPALPERYRSVAAKFGVVGAIAIEASPLPADNDWLLGVAEKNPLIVGVIGDLKPGDAAYSRDLDRLRRDALFLGVRSGNLWKRDLAEDVKKAGFLAGLKELAAARLVFESANPDAGLLQALGSISEGVSELRIVVDHLPHALLTADAGTRSRYQQELHRLAANPRVFIKLSEVPLLREGRLISDAAIYREALDALWGEFGEDRVVYGSDWPNSDTTAGFAETFRIVRRYVQTKGRVAAEKFYWKNSARVYRWKPRRADQPSPSSV